MPRLRPRLIASLATVLASVLLAPALTPLASAHAAPAAADAVVVLPGEKRITTRETLSAAPQVERRALSTSSASVTTTAVRSQWVVNYQGFTPEAQAAFQRAVDIWAAQVSSDVPIEINASFVPMAPGSLGAAGPANFIGAGGVAYPVVLANAIAGVDQIPGEADIVAEFSSTEPKVYYGTGTPAPDEVDFTTIVLHEIGHGLGYLNSSFVDKATGRGYYGLGQEPGTFPTVFDIYTVTSTALRPDVDLLSYADGSLDLGRALTGGELFWVGGMGRAAHNGSAPKLYAPGAFSESSSHAHLDDEEFPEGSSGALLTPFLENGETIREIPSIVMGMLGDMGYEVPALAGTAFTPLDPVRILDTRQGLGVRAGKLPGGSFVDLRVTGVAGVPGNATAVVLNLTAASPTKGTHIRLSPTPQSGSPAPKVSNLNVRAGENRANAVTVPVGDLGRVRLFNAAGEVSLIADVAGFYAPDAQTGFHPLAPSRVLDTRKGTGVATGATAPLGAGEFLDLSLPAVPAGAEAVVLNLTGISPTANTHLTAYPTPLSGNQVPGVSSLNVSRGQVTPNLVVVKLGPGGQVRLRNAAGSIHLAADLAGYYDRSIGGLRFHVLSPTRLLDTRLTDQKLVGPGGVRDIQIHGVEGVPAEARAVVANITGTSPTSLTHIGFYPKGPSPRADISNLNLTASQTAANSAYSAIGTDGMVQLRNHSGSTALIADFSGWFGPQ